MERILNSIEELYKLITGTLPEDYVEHTPIVTMDMLGNDVCYGNKHIVTCYFIVTEQVHDVVKIEYGKRGIPMVTDGKIYKYV